MKGFLKNKFNNHNFDITYDDNNFIFKLNGKAPLSKAFLIIKNHTTQQRIIKQIKNSKTTLTISDISTLGLGVYDVYLKTKLANKTFIKRSPFKKDHKDKYLIDSNLNLKLQTINFDENLSFRLKRYVDVSDSDVNLYKVQGEDITELIYNGDFKYNLSAIVLVYNGEPYLRDCLDSLVNQTIDGLEIILINDKSSDDSLAICKEFALKHKNIKIIDKQTNHGLATSANMGIQIAKGEYIILVDNDDIIPPDAYQKLYTKAKSTDADISIGQANLLYDDRQNEMYDAERRVLEVEKVINDISEFPELFNDAFYWNKIIKKSLIVENNITLPEGMIYADRKFAHTAFVYAKKIAIIPDCVYMWRIRLEDKNHESLSRKRNETWNYINRIDSYKQGLSTLTEIYPEYFKILMRRVIIPIRGILDSEEFEEAFYANGAQLLKDECSKLDDIYDNQFTNWDNIMIYLVLNDLKNQVKNMLKLDLTTQRSLIKKDDKIYWNLPLFENPEIPDELFEVKSMIPQFLKIDQITTSDSQITFKGIEIPDNLKTTKLVINFIGKTNYDGVLADNILTYEVVDGEVKISVGDLADFEVYDIFFKAYYSQKLTDNFRIEKQCIESIIQDNDDINIALTKYGNLSIISKRLDNSLILSACEESLKVKIAKDKLFKQDLHILLENDSTHEKAEFTLEDGEYVLKWENFLDDKSTYSFKISLFDEKLARKNVDLNKKYLVGFNPISVKNLKISADESDNLKLF